jgi:hypothetical protein
MTSLAEWQGAFAEALVDAETPPPTGIRTPRKRPTGPSAERRFAIYRNNVTTALIDTLRATFPVVEALVGKSFFEACARAYARQAPPRSPLLFHYGADFGAFLAAFPPAGSVPYLGDVARLEFARLKALHAAAATSLPIDAIAHLSPSELTGLVFRFHPSATLLQSPFPIVSIWFDVRGEGSPGSVDLGVEETALVLRPALDVEVHAIASGGGAFFAALMNGACLGSAADIAQMQTAEFDLPAHLAMLFKSGSVIGS